MRTFIFRGGKWSSYLEKKIDRKNTRANNIFFSELNYAYKMNFTSEIKLYTTLMGQTKID